jgi:hypothetical protein
LIASAFTITMPLWQLGSSGITSALVIVYPLAAMMLASSIWLTPMIS